MSRKKSAPSFDPYAVLGVEKDADKAHIKKAYRGRAKDLHPDTGGDAEKFGALSRAYTLLMDDERRQRYDRTGDGAEQEPDNAHVSGLAMLATSFFAAVEKLSKLKRVPLEADLVREMDQCLAEEIDNQRTTQENNLRSIEKWKKYLGRFHTKKGPNVVEHAINQQLAQYLASNRAIDGQIKAMEQAREMVKWYTFDADTPTPLDPQELLMAFQRQHPHLFRAKAPPPTGSGGGYR